MASWLMTWTLLNRGIRAELSQLDLCGFAVVVAVVDGAVGLAMIFGEEWERWHMVSMINYW